MTLLSFQPGNQVTYIDEQGNFHAALVMQWWGKHTQAACNLVYIDPKSDSHGQEVLVSSVPPKSDGCHGHYWQPSGDNVTGVLAE